VAHYFLKEKADRLSWSKGINFPCLEPLFCAARAVLFISVRENIAALLRANQNAPFLKFAQVQNFDRSLLLHNTAVP
jgi:hypothetical protein